MLYLSFVLARVALVVMVHWCCVYVPEIFHILSIVQSLASSPNSIPSRIEFARLQTLLTRIVSSLNRKKAAFNLISIVRVGILFVFVSHRISKPVIRTTQHGISRLRIRTITYRVDTNSMKMWFRRMFVYNVHKQLAVRSSLVSGFWPISANPRKNKHVDIPFELRLHNLMVVHRCYLSLNFTGIH